MNITVLTKTYENLPICEGEVLRYMGQKKSSDEVSSLLNGCLSEAEKVFSYKVCYCKLPVKISGNVCDFGVFSLSSKNLAQNLNGANNVILFAATAGVGIDRLIAKYNKISPSKAVVFQAIGTEAAEAVCDAFCQNIKTEFGDVKPRFSPGYGDLPLDLQKQIFALLSPEKNIGLTLNESLLMSPSKSVTAFVGLV